LLRKQKRDIFLQDKRIKTVFVIMLLIVPQYKLWFSYPHPGILYLASSVRKIGEDVELIDGGILTEKEYFKKLKDSLKKHQKIGITVSVAHVASAVKTARFIRTHYPEKEIIWGGPYASSQYEMITNELADIIVIGEGEIALASICKEEKLSRIPSIIYFENGKRKINPRHSYIEDLDKLPFPAYDLIDFNAYESPGLKPTGQIISTRGCPYQCINCTKIIHGDLYRKRSPENTVEEILLLANKYKVREIHFWDDNLTLDIERVKKICDLILKKGINKNVRFAVPAGIRADIYDEEMFLMMKKANFYLLSVAVESGVQSVIDKIGKKLDLRRVPENLKKIEKHGFRILLYFMMGFPFENDEDMKNTVKFAAKLPGHHLNCFAVVPLPGSKLFEEWKVIPEFQNYLSVNYDNPIPKARSYEKERILKNNIRFAYLKFYSNPLRILKTIKLMIKEGSFLNDLRFILKNIYKLFLMGHK